MASHRIRRALAASAVLSLVVTTAAVADTLTPDGDALTTGAQTSVYLGAVDAGSSHPVDVDFVLACAGSSHLVAGSTVSIAKVGLTVPGDGSATVAPGSVTVPATWPAAGEDCPATLTAVSTTPAHVVVTAPTTAGPGREFDVRFVPDPDTGAVTNPIYFAIVMDVVDPAPTDDTPPVLHDVPGSLTVTTAGTSAVVSWPLPTATDDTDPDPVVGCSPDSGSTFGLGTTTVTCTATDAADNSADASFDVTVVHVAALTGSWGQPLDDALPAAVGRVGRTLPLKLSVTAGGSTQGPADIVAPILLVAPLDACSAEATAGDPVAQGAFRWGDGAWRLNLRTGDLGPGCWRLEARVGGEVAATAIIRLEAGQVVASLRRH